MNYLLFTLTIVFWGVNPILTRLCSDIIGIKPYMIVTTILSSTCTIVINTLLQRDVWNDLNRLLFRQHDDLWKRWLIILTDSILCLSTPSILYNILLSTTSSIAIVVTTTWYGAPILTCILSSFIFKQSISHVKMGGIIVSIIGIVMMNIEDIIRDLTGYTELIADDFAAL